MNFLLTILLWFAETPEPAPPSMPAELPSSLGWVYWFLAVGGGAAALKVITFAWDKVAAIFDKYAVRQKEAKQEARDEKKDKRDDVEFLLNNFREEIERLTERVEKSEHDLARTDEKRREERIKRLELEDTVELLKRRIMELEQIAVKYETETRRRQELETELTTMRLQVKELEARIETLNSPPT